MRDRDAANHLLSQFDVEPRLLVDRLRNEGPNELLLDALALSSDPKVRAILCDLLGFRKAAAATGLLTDCLSDPDEHVRGSAADALAKIGDPTTGSFVFQKLVATDPSPGVQRMLIAAVGAVHYEPAVATLIALLKHADPSTRGTAAWSLGQIGNAVALGPLEAAVGAETHAYPTQRMHEALRTLKELSQRP